jgi:hypothetical protein
LIPKGSRSVRRGAVGKGPKGTSLAAYPTARTVLKTSEGSDPLTESNRAIRPGVLWRKASFGTHSPEGSRCVEAMMTVVATLTQQHRNVLDYVTATCEAALRGDPAPSWLPTRDHLHDLMRPAA